MSVEAVNRSLGIGLPENVCSRESRHNGIVMAGEVRTETENHKRLEVVTHEYVKRSYLNPEDADIVKNGGVYIDQYETDPTTLKLAVHSEGNVNGSLRLVMANGGNGLPIQSDEIMEKFSTEAQKIAATAENEWTQFAKSRRVASDERPTVALIRAGIQASRNRNINGGVGVIDKRVYQLLTGPKYDFILHQLSDEFMHMGSMCLPIHFDFDELLEASRLKGHGDLVDFINHGSAPAHEWYRGI